MTKKDLNYLYDNCYTYSFDKKDKIVFMSDVHRGDGTYYDSLLQNRNIYLTALKYYFRNDFTYVEIGDGDELWKNKDYTEIAYAYEEVYRVFNKFKKKGKIFIIYGNHDIIKSKKKFVCKQQKKLARMGNEYGREFVNFIKNTTFFEGINFLYTPLNEKFLAVHGHQMDSMNSTFKDISMFLVRYIWKFLYGIAGFKDPTSCAKSKSKRGIVDNKLLDWVKKNGKMIICGHTHNTYFPDKSEVPYFNDGCCVLPDAVTAIEIENGEISLVKWSVQAQETGILWVRRMTIAEPAPISNYLLWAKDRRTKTKEMTNNDDLKGE